MLHVICKDIQRHNTLNLTQKFFYSAHKKEKTEFHVAKKLCLLAAYSTPNTVPFQIYKRSWDSTHIGYIATISLNHEMLI